MLESEIKTQNLSFNDVGLIIYDQKKNQLKKYKFKNRDISYKQTQNQDP